MQNRQAIEAGKLADERIKQLANPSDNIVTDKTEVQVLDKAQDVAHPTQKEEPAKAAPVPVDDYKERFTRYKASTDITIRDLRTEVARLQSFESENDVLKEKLQAALEQVPSTPSELLESFSSDEVNAFQKLVDGKVGGLKDEVKRLKDELADAKETTKANTAKNRLSNIIQTVRAAVDGYDEMNVDPAFMDYMKDVDEFGFIRMDLLNRAKASTPPDINRIIQFYKDFASNTVASATPAQEEPTTTVNSQKELLQNPTSIPSGGQEAPQNVGRVWTSALAKQLYADRARGHLTTDQFKALEAEMNESIRTGRFQR